MTYDIVGGKNPDGPVAGGELELPLLSDRRDRWLRGICGCRVNLTFITYHSGWHAPLRLPGGCLGRRGQRPAAAGYSETGLPTWGAIAMLSLPVLEVEWTRRARPRPPGSAPQSQKRNGQFSNEGMPTFATGVEIRPIRVYEIPQNAQLADISDEDSDSQGMEELGLIGQTDDQRLV